MVKLPQPTDGTLRGQVALVTGAGRGVGRAIAESLSAAGARVALISRSSEAIDGAVAAIGEQGGEAIALTADVTDEAAVTSVVAEAESRLGPPTLLVNNAGSWCHLGPLESADPAAWWKDVEVCLKGSFLCTRAVLPGMRARSFGRIVNVSSYAALSPRPYATAYACAKAALLRLTDSLEEELRGSGVLTFAITPGFVRTRMVARHASSEEGRRYAPGLATRQDAVDPMEAGRLVVEIASGRVDALTGRLLHVLDDLDELLTRAAEIREHDLYTLRFSTLK